MRLRAGLPVLWRSQTDVQVGTDPRWAVSLADLSPSAATALRSVGAGAHVREIRRAFAREQVPVEADAVLDHLRAAELLVPDRPGSASTDAAAWAVVSPDGDGARLVAARSRIVVRLVGLGRLGSALAAQLAVAGVGSLELEDGRPVDRHDLAPGGLSARDMGADRASATARVVHEVAPGISTAVPGRRPVDLVILVEQGVADPVRHRTLLDLDVPHLSVVVREASVVVGPLVLPGRSACLRCVDLHRGDVDDGWPAVAAQLAGPSHDRPVETSVAGMATALAAAQVLAHLDRRPTSVHDASWEIRLPEVLPRRTTWTAHPDCDCAGPPAPVRQDEAADGAPTP